jgi:hypothetical protein
MKYRINIGGQSYYKTEKEIPDFAKNIPPVNKAVNQIVESLTYMHKHERMSSGDKIDSLEGIIDGMLINVRIEP